MNGAVGATNMNPKSRSLAILPRQGFTKCFTVTQRFFWRKARFKTFTSLLSLMPFFLKIVMQRGEKIYFAPRMHQLCTKNAPTLRQEFTNFAPRMHQLCANIVQHGSNKAWKTHRRTRGKTDATEGPKITKFSKPSIYFRSNLPNLVDKKSISFSKLSQ